MKKIGAILAIIFILFACTLEAEARWYSPEMRRFLSEDPIGFAGGDVNFYAYVGNDPVNYTDPLGLEAIISGDFIGPDETYDSQCVASCIEDNRFSSFAPAITGINLGNAALNASPLGQTPRSGIGTPVHSTSWQHKLGMKLSRSTGNIAFSRAGRLAGRALVVPTIFEGFYDWGVIGSCYNGCRNNVCNK